MCSREHICMSDLSAFVLVCMPREPDWVWSGLMKAAVSASHLWPSWHEHDPHGASAAPHRWAHQGYTGTQANHQCHIRPTWKIKQSSCKPLLRVCLKLQSLIDWPLGGSRTSWKHNIWYYYHIKKKKIGDCVGKQLPICTTSRHRATSSLIWSRVCVQYSLFLLANIWLSC